MKLKSLDKDTYNLLWASVKEANSLNSLVNKMRETITKILCYHTDLSESDVADWTMDCVYNGKTLDSVLKSLKIKIQ